MLQTGPALREDVVRNGSRKHSLSVPQLALLAGEQFLNICEVGNWRARVHYMETTQNMTAPEIAEAMKRVLPQQPETQLVAAAVLKVRLFLTVSLVCTLLHFVLSCRVNQQRQLSNTWRTRRMRRLAKRFARLCLLPLLLQRLEHLALSFRKQWVQLPQVAPQHRTLAWISQRVRLRRVRTVQPRSACPPKANSQRHLLA